MTSEVTKIMKIDNQIFLKKIMKSRGIQVMKLEDNTTNQIPFGSNRNEGGTVKSETDVRFTNKFKVG